MNHICDDILLYKLNNFLEIKNKQNLRLVNKYFNKIESKIINFHIGTFIANFIGLELNNKYDLKILKEFPLEFSKEISNYLLNEIDIDEINNKKYSILPIGILLKINCSSLEECKIKLKEPGIFRKHNKLPTYLKKNINKFKKIYYHSKTFLNIYAIL